MIRFALLAAAIVSLTACALSPGPSHQPLRQFDFGPRPADASVCEVDAQLGVVKASPAVSGTDMWYRYDDRPYSPEPFAFSRWTAPPAELLRRRLQIVFSGAAAAGRVDLEVFRVELQVGSGATAEDAVDARVSVDIGAVYRAPDGRPLDHQLFKLSHEAAASPEGAAQAVGEALINWQRELCRWAERIAESR